jgi:hypothetical protein
MNLKGIVSLSGKPGLFKALAQNRSGFVLESLDAAKNKVVTNPTSRLATLDDITVFGQDDDITLISILEKMKELAASTPVPDPKADGKVLRDYFTTIVPNHDAERVYSSDIKKIIVWYGILSALPLWDEEAPKEPSNEEEN